MERASTGQGDEESDTRETPDHAELRLTQPGNAARKVRLPGVHLDGTNVGDDILQQAHALVRSADVAPDRLEHDDAYEKELPKAGVEQVDVPSVPGGTGSSPGATPVLSSSARSGDRDGYGKAASAKEAQWVPKARWVVDGNVWTASGLAAGLDMALAWITHLAGAKSAATVSSGAEYTGRSADHDEFVDIWSEEAQAALVKSLGEWMKSL